MSNNLRASAVLVLGLALAWPALANDSRPFGGGPVHGGTMSSHSAGVSVQHAMPPHGFRGSPPGFHGTLPHPSHPPTMHRPIGKPGHDLSLFHGHDFRHFTPIERTHWEHGSWRHVWHRGHFGWWWCVDDFWFFYPAPIFPYPLYVGSDAYYDYDDEYGAPPYYWYYCSDPEGYYPYVTDCNVPWQQVPPTPDNE